MTLIQMDSNVGFGCRSLWSEALLPPWGSEKSNLCTVTPWGQFESRQWWSHRFDNIRRYLVHSTLYVGSAWLSSTFRWHQYLNSWTILVTWLKDLAEGSAQINWSLYENCGKLRVKSASFSTDNDQTLRLFTLYCISNHKNFIPKHLDNALTDFTQNTGTSRQL